MMEELLLEIEKNKERLVIVEGKKDVFSLKKLGFKNVSSMNKPFFKIIEEISKEYKEIVILTDLDKKGKEIYGKLKKEFCRRGIKINDNLRNLLFKTKLRQIEGLNKYIERNQQYF